MTTNALTSVVEIRDRSKSRVISNNQAGCTLKGQKRRVQQLTTEENLQAQEFEEAERQARERAEHARERAEQARETAVQAMESAGQAMKTAAQAMDIARQAKERASQLGQQRNNWSGE